MLIVIMLIVIMLIVIMLIVIMLNVVAPLNWTRMGRFFIFEMCNRKYVRTVNFFFTKFNIYSHCKYYLQTQQLAVL